mmetsp:Transcript_9316/g.15438  ORF Transcript_9316/g.15438 Transcript_9316/m.15438 type:complete len:882 (-) Transcript_9316:1988-4633(-)
MMTVYAKLTLSFSLLLRIFVSTSLVGHAFLNRPLATLGTSSSIIQKRLVSSASSNTLLKRLPRPLKRYYSLAQLHMSSLGAENVNTPPNTGNINQISFKVVSFNILAPCYKRMVDDKGEKCLESVDDAKFITRNRAICEQLLATDADVICLQEFWSGNEDLRELYTNMLCSGPSGCYSVRVLPRTSHWNKRSDSIAIFVKNERLEIEDVRDILFHDVGDRVALMLLLAYRPPIGSDTCSSSSSSSIGARTRGSLESTTPPVQRFVVVNTHLLFPHNPFSSKIRLREVTKILGFVEGYRQKELCATVCDRSDVRLPVILAGDFNGSPRGGVYRYVRSQNYRSALEEEFLLKSYPSHEEEEEEEEEIYAEEDVGLKSKIEGSELSTTATRDDRWVQWVSHKSHLNKDVAVDHIFYLNPSDQVEDRLPPLPDWTNLVFQELMQKIVDNNGATSVRDVFAAFDLDASDGVTREEFAETIRRLGFMGEGTASLTNEEIDMLVRSADKDNDGQIDFREFYDRLWLASALHESESRAVDPLTFDFHKDASASASSSFSSLSAGAGAAAEAEAAVTSTASDWDRSNDWWDESDREERAFWMEADGELPLIQQPDYDEDNVSAAGIDKSVNKGASIRSSYTGISTTAEAAAAVSIKKDGEEMDSFEYLEDVMDPAYALSNDLPTAKPSPTVAMNSAINPVLAANATLQNRKLQFARNEWLSKKEVTNVTNQQLTGEFYESALEINILREVFPIEEEGEEVIILKPMSTSRAMREVVPLEEEKEEIILLHPAIASTATAATATATATASNTTHPRGVSPVSAKELAVSPNSAVVGMKTLATREDAVSMGDLEVVAARIIPEEMERGIWPENYTLSDHGAVECVFRAKIHYE